MVFIFWGDLTQEVGTEEGASSYDPGMQVNPPESREKGKERMWETPFFCKKGAPRMAILSHEQERS